MRYHEEWMLDLVERLGRVAAIIIEKGDGPTLRDALEGLQLYVAAWSEWASAPDIDMKFAILEEAGL